MGAFVLFCFFVSLFLHAYNPSYCSDLRAVRPSISFLNPDTPRPLNAARAHGKHGRAWQRCSGPESNWTADSQYVNCSRWQPLDETSCRGSLTTVTELEYEKNK
ncbi:hypothetical protein GGR53DRAFT_482514 [Hypoxylon sp. FL1150]|nr:hypothetical protein GGR53DRAFT_482514 [Hypoxylon sp. FL1150]